MRFYGVKIEIFLNRPKRDFGDKFRRKESVDALISGSVIDTPVFGEYGANFRHDDETEFDIMHPDENVHKSSIAINQDEKSGDKFLLGKVFGFV